MTDRLTRSDLLPCREEAPLSRRIAAAWRALPQVRAVSRRLYLAARTVSSALRWWWLKLSCRLGPVVRRTARRLGAWLRGTRPVRAAAAWWRRTKKALWELPQFQFLRRVHLFFTRHALVHFAFYTALLVAVLVPWCLNHREVAQDDNIYLLVDSQTPRVIYGYPTEDYTGELLYMHAGSNTRDAQIVLLPGQLVTVRHGDKALTLFSNHETVANLLRRVEVQPDESEMVAVNAAGSGIIIHVAEELRFERTQTTPTPHGTYIYPNYLLEKGLTNVVQEGKNGVITDTYEDVYRRGELVSSHLVYRSDTSAVTEIIEHGRLVSEMAQDCRAVEDHPYRDGREGGYLVFENGDSMTYSKTVVNNSTAYYTGPITATGHPVGMGVIAVDPKVYPYYTSMYIGSVDGGSYYGIGTAYDCGGAVKGNIIDVWFPSIADCYGWGRRNVTCYILDARSVT